MLIQRNRPQIYYSSSEGSGGASTNQVIINFSERTDKIEKALKELIGKEIRFPHARGFVEGYLRQYTLNDNLVVFVSPNLDATDRGCPTTIPKRNSLTITIVDKT